MAALLGVLFHAIGGFAAGSFYIPFKIVKNWSWESSWLVLGITAWILSPFVFAYFTVPDLWLVLMGVGNSTKFWTFLFGVLWGIGGLTFGLSMRYLGISLGMTVALGFCTAFGTLIPPIYEGTLGSLVMTRTGQFTLLGIIGCLLATGLVGWAGMRKEKEESFRDSDTKAVIEFNFNKGILVAIISGILSACFAFGLKAGAPIAEMAEQTGTKQIFKNNVVLVWILWGGILTNGLYSLFLNWKNKSTRDYLNNSLPLVRNYLWAMLGGLTWYLQFFFYGMGATKLGEQYDFASWSIHMAFIILFSNLWGIFFKEWKGASNRTNLILVLGLLVILISILLIGMADMLAQIF